MNAKQKSMRLDGTRLLELLIKATRTSDENESKYWWKYFYENLDPPQLNGTSLSSQKKSYFSFFHRQAPSLNETIQVLAEQLDKDNFSVLHYIAYHNNLYICRQLAHVSCDFNTSGDNGETILHIAARSKIIDKVTEEQQQQSLLQYLLSTLTRKRKPLVNLEKRDDQGRTALHHAVMANRIANVKLLLDHQACIAARDRRQATPLHYACRFNRSSTIVRYLLAKSDSIGLRAPKSTWMGLSASQKTCFPISSKLDYINARTRDGHDAFSLARTYDHTEILDELFQHIPSDDLRWREKDKMIFNQIYKAILAEDLPTLQAYPIWLVINENTGETILHVACVLGCSTAVSQLLQDQNFDRHGPNVLFLREKHHGFTPLLSAAYAGQAKCFEHVLDAILKFLTTKTYRQTFIRDIFIDRFDRSLLHLCILSRQSSTLEIFMSTVQSNPFLYVELIEPMIYFLDYNDETPLHLAVRLNLSPMCQLLLQFADELDQIQQPCIYLDSTDGQLMRSVDIVTKTLHSNFPLNQSRVFVIGCTSKAGRSAFHLAILYGYRLIMNLFLQHVDPSGRTYLLEHPDADIRTPLHLAALKGYTEIVQQLFSFNVNVYTRDAQESTPLHCVARCIERKCYDDNDASVCILEIFLKYIQNCKTISFDLLTALDGFGHNCLETAILSRNRSFVEYLLNLNNIPLFKNLLQNAQFLDTNYHHIDTPLRKLVTCMPDLAYRVLDTCITSIGEKHKIIYDFQFLEDQCSVEQWQNNLTPQTRTLPPVHRSCWSIFSRHKPLQFQSQFQHQPLLAYTSNCYTLVHNNVLSVMCKCAKQIDLKDPEIQEEESHKKDMQYSYKLMHHPLCRTLLQLKWKQYGLPLFLTSFLIYCLYLTLFTAVMLKNKQPEYFYRLVNTSFPTGRFRNETQVDCIEVARRLVRFNIQEAMKQPADRVLKILVIVLLWIHVVKDAILIIFVHRCSFVSRLYIETTSLILSFICLYDNDRWQHSLKLRCPVQWQVGAFGILLAWVTLLSYLRFIPIFGVYVVMLEVIVIKFLWFAPVLVVLICSFSFAFYMLLQNQPVFSTIPFAWFRSAFMVMDTGYEDRFFGPDSDAYISLYPVLFVLFLLFGVTMTILVNNLLTALAVGEIADLSAIARVRNATRRYELLREWEIFRLQCLWTPATLHVRHEHIEKSWNRQLQVFLKWIYRYTFLKSND